MTLTVHHLENSRSQRVLWLLEELAMPCEVKRYARDKKTSLAPPELAAIHPLGKSPAISDGKTVVAETGAIVEYLLDAAGDTALRPARGSADGLRFTYWLHFAEGSAMPPLVMALVFNKVRTAPMPFFARPIARGIADKVMGSFVQPNIDRQLAFMQAELTSRPPVRRPGLQRRRHQSVHRVARDDATGDARTRVAGGLGLVVVGHGVNDQALADDVGRAGTDGHARQVELDVDAALRIGLERRQITGMALGAVMRAMRLGAGIEVPAGAHAVAAAAVAFFMDVKAVLLAGLEALDLGVHHDLLALLVEHHHARDGVALGGFELGHRHRATAVHHLHAARAAGQRGRGQQGQNHRSSRHSFAFRVG